MLIKLIFSRLPFPIGVDSTSPFCFVFLIDYLLTDSSLRRDKKVFIILQSIACASWMINLPLPGIAASFFSYLRFCRVLRGLSSSFHVLLLASASSSSSSAFPSSSAVVDGPVTVTQASWLRGFVVRSLLQVLFIIIVFACADEASRQTHSTINSLLIHTRCAAPLSFLLLFPCAYFHSGPLCVFSSCVVGVLFLLLAVAVCVHVFYV